MGSIRRWLFGACLLLSALPAFAAIDHDHAAWTSLLGRHVHWNEAGTGSAVDYAGFARDRRILGRYLETLGAVSRPEYDGWTWPQRQAFLINAYNAATVQLVLTRYPHLKSIKDLGGLFSTPWKRNFVTLLGQDRSLDDIEHRLLRGAVEYRDPRIHFAVNCASISCPALRPEAFVADRLEAQLQDQALRFLRDRTRNRLRPGPTVTLELSSIFEWYGHDFARAGGVVAFVSGYTNVLGASPAEAAGLRRGDLRLRFLPYDWALNDIARRER